MKTFAPAFLSLLVVASFLACAADPPQKSASPSAGSSSASPSSSAPEATVDCNAVAAKAGARVLEVLSANEACTTDADCTTVGFASQCFDSCSRGIAQKGAAAFSAIVADVNAHECKDFAAHGCKLTVPPCLPPKPVACRKGICE
jgi:hypothetical protein